MKIKSRSNKPLAKRARKGFPVATVAFYGPDDQHASKLVIGIISHEGAEPKLRQWHSDDTDLRSVPGIESEIKAFIKGARGPFCVYGAVKISSYAGKLYENFTFAGQKFHLMPESSS